MNKGIEVKGEIMREPTREEMVEGIAQGVRRFLEKWRSDDVDFKGIRNTEDTLREIFRRGVSDGIENAERRKTLR